MFMFEFTKSESDPLTKNCLLHLSKPSSDVVWRRHQEPQTDVIHLCLNVVFNILYGSFVALGIYTFSGDLRLITTSQNHLYCFESGSWKDYKREIKNIV